MQDLKQYLVDRGVDLEGWTLMFANNMTRDGSVITGTGVGPTGVRAWIARVDEGPACPADIDGSGDVGFADLLELLTNWGPCVGCPQDLDGNDDVGFSDLLIVLTSWGPCP